MIYQSGIGMILLARLVVCMGLDTDSDLVKGSVIGFGADIDVLSSICIGYWFRYLMNYQLGIGI